MAQKKSSAKKTGKPNEKQAKGRFPRMRKSPVTLIHVGSRTVDIDKIKRRVRRFLETGKTEARVYTPANFQQGAPIVKGTHLLYRVGPGSTFVGVKVSRVGTLTIAQ